MKNDIHPNWNHTTVVTCACGSTFETGSTQQALRVDICSACHPYFTGEMKFVDTQGRVDKFVQKMKKAQAQQHLTKKTKSVNANDDQKSYRQLLQEQKHTLKQLQTTPQA